MAKRWYVVHAYSGFEKQVKRSLEDRIERAGMQDLNDGQKINFEVVNDLKTGKSSADQLSAA